ncbi:hypothetical protein QZH41_012297 [Actinostola sp. cb2023]|nr:hypothetical protein QZH41_012297 [Actinostola sp. cb2023]
MEKCVTALVDALALDAQDGSLPDQTQPRITHKCKCGNSEINHLVSANECACCHEIERCVTSLADALVLQDSDQCAWKNGPSRVSAGKYRCRDRRHYKQTGSEACFLRTVAYREFTYLIHGTLGDNRIALPACAYNAIREKFKDNGETFTGFDDNM